MKEINIKFQCINSHENKNEIIISVDKNFEDKLLYKFMIGLNGTWETIKDFGYEDKATWTPREEGKYFVIVQGKKEECKKPFEYVSRANYTIGNLEEKLIDAVEFNRESYLVGDRLKLSVHSKALSLMYRYWLKYNDKWELVKDYTAENSLNLSLKNVGVHEFLVECKRVQSKDSFDDFMCKKFQVEKVKEIQISNFKATSNALIKDEEISFKVEANFDRERTILYKFVKIKVTGEAVCVQDYSTQSTVSYIEKESGEYKLLCMAKDMYSQNYYDDRAIINFKVKNYREIKIKSFNANINSPQTVTTSIELKAEAKGGKNLLYRFIIDGNSSEDSGYLRNNTYLWKSKVPGEYIIKLWVKDASFEGIYEAAEEIEYKIEEKNVEPVSIKDVIIEGDRKLLVNSAVSVKVIAAGGSSLRYSFIVKKEGEFKENIDYGSCNWVNFTPEEVGEYELLARVKDKFSEREFDSEAIVHIEAMEYIPANIDYILMPYKECYTTGDNIVVSVIAQNTTNTLVKYVLNVNGHKAYESQFSLEKEYTLTAKCSGVYTIEIYAKNLASGASYDCKKEIKLRINEALPITNTKILLDTRQCKVNVPITFTAESEGGKEVLYEFYIMEKGDWIIGQEYSRKNSFTFIPFSKGDYSVLALAKSSYTKCSYEDYEIIKLSVSE